jgi:toxin FitB
VSFLLDTNVVSEWTKPQPNPGVVRWLAEADEDRLFLSVITLAELRRGVERLVTSARKKRLEEWIEEDLRPRFDQRILSVDEDVANCWGRLIASSEARGRRMQLLDGFLAATAVVRGHTFVTRNVADFEVAGCVIVNPWS